VAGDDVIDDDCWADWDNWARFIYIIIIIITTTQQQKTDTDSPQKHQRNYYHILRK